MKIIELVARDVICGDERLEWDRMPDHIAERFYEEGEQKTHRSLAYGMNANN